MNDLIIKDNIKIEDLIYEIRGKQVMLDSDLAKLFQITTGNLNKAKSRNINRFPEDFCFRLTKAEYASLIFQNGISKIDGRIVNRGYPFAYTEEGVAMLSSILKTSIAEEMSIMIMRAFVAMRRFIKENNYNFRISNLETKYIEHDTKIDMILDKLSTKEEINHIFYEGQIYDAYDLFMKILSMSKKEIIIIDNYAGRELFNIIKDIKVKVKIYTKNIDNIAKAKYEEQYSNMEIITTDIFHDRFILIYNKTLYHSGASFKDIGKKCFGINKIEDTNVIKDLISRLEVIK